MPNRVLVVDDNDDAAELLALALTSVGYVVRTASDARSALAVADEFNPEVALLDIGLPDMDGYELGRRLRDAHFGLHLLALTGYGRPSDKLRSTEAGFRAHLIKPVPLVELQRILTSMAPQNGSSLLPVSEAPRSDHCRND
jgi:two-component system CheB/CheR fusion protein